MAVQLSFSSNQQATAGGILHGSLSLCVARSVQAQRLEVYFRGKEYTSARVQSGKNSHTVTDKHQIVRINIPANDANRIIRQNGWKLPTGVYEIPFSIRMPSNLPSNASFQGSGYSEHARIEYCLRAKLNGSGIFQDYQARQGVRFHARAEPIQTIPRRVPPQLHDIRFLKLSKQGLAAVGAKADDSLLIPGQRVRIDLAIDNASGATIHSIRVVLREKVIWKAHHYMRFTKKNLLGVSKNTSAQLKKLNPELLEANRRNLNRKERSLQKISEQLITRDGLISLLLPPLPASSHNSHMGSLVTVTHELKVTLETKQWCSNPTLLIPVRIARGQECDELPVARIIRRHRCDEMPVATSVEPFYCDDEVKEIGRAHV